MNIEGNDKLIHNKRFYQDKNISEEKEKKSAQNKVNRQGICRGLDFLIPGYTLKGAVLAGIHQLPFIEMSAV